MRRSVFVLLLLALGACAKDRTLDEWQREEANRELGKIQAISAQYGQGNLVSNSTGKNLGLVVITLGPDTQLRPSNDGTTTTQQAALQGTIDFYGPQRAQLVFRNGSYDSDKGTFNAQFTMQEADGRSYAFVISGTIVGNRLTGTLEALGYPESGASFSLTRVSGTGQNLVVNPSPVGDDPSLQVQKLSTPSPIAIGTRAPETVTMSIQFNSATSDERFLNLLIPLSSAQVTFSFYGGREQIYFDQASYDEHTGRLTGVTHMNVGNAVAEFSMNCWRENQGGASGWHCRLGSSRRPLLFDTFFAQGT